MGKLPKDAEIGDIVETEITIKGKKGKEDKKRYHTHERVKPYGKNKNLKWKLIKNESPIQYRKRKAKEKQKEKQKNKL